MAKQPQDLQVIGQSIGETPVQARSTNAFVALGQATAGLADIVTSAAQEIHTEQAALLGEQAALSGQAPSQLPVGFNKSQREYNKAIINTEGRQLAQAGSTMILENLAKSLDPATFNAQTPVEFNSSTNAIVNEFVSQARDGNRAFVAQSLADTLNRAKLKMTETAIEFDSKQRNKLFEKELGDAVEGLVESVKAKDTDEASHFSENIRDIFDDYSIIDESIARRIPEIKEKIEDELKQAEVVGDFLQATDEGRSAKFLLDFMKSKPEHLTHSEWEKAAKTIVSMNSLNDKLVNEARGEQVAIVRGQINEGSITDTEIYNNELLTLGQKQSLVNDLKDVNQRREAKIESIAKAQTNILMGRPAALTGTQLTDMYESSQKINEQMLASRGQEGPMSLEQIADSILGTGDVFPVSGIPGVGVGRSIPEFDTIVSNNLTSGDPKSQAMGILVYNKMVNLANKPNSLNISGDALSMATLGSSLVRGNTISYEDAAMVSAKAVLDKKDPEVIRRRDRFAKDISSELESRFKDDFGIKVQPFATDAAFGRYAEIYEAQYISSNSDDAAREAARYSMAGIGTDPDYPEGYAGDAPPHKTLNIAQMDNEAWNNQKIIAMQQIINDNKELRSKGRTQTVIEWASPEDSVDIASLTDEQKVMQPLFTSKKHIPGVASPFGAQVGEGFDIDVTRMPQIKVNGQDSDFKLMDGPDVRFGDDGRFIYTFFYTDRSGNLRPLEDVSNIKSVAQIQPMELLEYAPGVFTEENNKKLSRQAEDIRQEKLKGVVRRAKEENFFLKFLSTDAVAGLVGQLADEDPAEAKKLVEQLEKVHKGEQINSLTEPVDAEDEV